MKLTGQLADYVTPGTLTGTVFSFSVAESDSGLTGQMTLTISGRHVRWRNKHRETQKRAGITE